MRFIRTIIAYIMRMISRLLTPSTAGIVRDFERKIVKLNRVVDAENDEAAAQARRRGQLRSQINRTWDDQFAAEDRAFRATQIRNNLEEIINV